MPKGIVYILINPCLDGWVKISITKHNDIDRRLKELNTQTNLPFSYCCYAIYSSIKKHSVVLNQVFTEAARNRLIQRNPCEFAKIPKIAAKSENTASFYTTEQCEKLLEVTEGTIKKHNLPHIRWHDLRHSTASMLIEKGWHMKDISEWLGHSDIGTTMNIYGHISMEHKKELGNSLIGLLD